MKKLDKKLVSNFKVSILRVNRKSLDDNIIKTLMRMDDALAKAIIERKILPEVGDTIHFQSINPKLELKIINLIPISSKEELKDLIIYGESNIF